MSNLFIQKRLREQNYLKVFEDMRHAPLKPSAKMVWFELLSLPNDGLWNFNESYLSNNIMSETGGKLSKKKIDSAFRDLKDYGCVIRVGLHNGQRVTQFVICVSDKPIYKFDRQTEAYPIVRVDPEDLDRIAFDTVSAAKIQAEVDKALEGYTEEAKNETVKPEPTPPIPGYPASNPPQNGTPFTNKHSILKNKETISKGSVFEIIQGFAQIAYGSDKVPKIYEHDFDNKFVYPAESIAERANHETDRAIRAIKHVRDACITERNFTPRSLDQIHPAVIAQLEILNHEPIQSEKLPQPNEYGII